MEKLLELVTKLRSPQGCPWDRKQTHLSVRPQLISECYELIETIDRQDDNAMKEELGDVLFQVVFHAQLAQERGAFTFGDVVQVLCDKLTRRHAHVFGDKKAADVQEALTSWNQAKTQEKAGQESALAGIPKELPSLMQAEEVQKEAARAGFDWKEVEPVFHKIHEEFRELEESMFKQGIHRGEIESELGDLFFAIVNLSRHLQLDAEQACRKAVQKFINRFQWMEKQIAEKGRNMHELKLEELDIYWERSKVIFPQ
ncbi:MAG: nucleoside triphosphate pyrophosphohydrolase [Verrucomicrobiota bacterium]